MAKRWYTITASEQDAAAAEVNIFDAIGNTWDGEGVTAKKFISDLAGVKGRDLSVFINSPGGAVADGLAIYNALQQHKGSSAKKGAKCAVNVKVMGVAASAASFIAMAGDTITMPANTFMMVHNPLSFAYGNAGELRDTADVLDKIGASLVGIYVSRTGLPEAEVQTLLDNETWLSAEDAKSKGFCDVVIENVKATASFDLARMPSNVRQSFDAARAAKSVPVATIMAKIGTMRGGATPVAFGEDDCCEFGSAVALSADGNVMVVTDSDCGAVYTYDWTVVQGSGSWVQRPFVANSPVDGAMDSKPLATEIKALAEKSGLAEYVATFAVLDSLSAAKSRIEDAQQIVALCDVLAIKDKAAGYVRSGKTYAEVRAAIIAERAEGDEQRPTNSTADPSGKEDPAGQVVKAAKPLNVSAVWEKRRAQQALQTAR